jgi:probable FeS assembly SUF system protein SufT
MTVNGQEITLAEDCSATRIPSGEELQLKKGESYMVSQALGGSVTLRDGAGLYRVDMEAAAALPESLVTLMQEAASGLAEDSPFSEEQVWTVLRQCFDPEIPVNIVDLGLIYDLAAQPLDGGHHHVEVKMTLTATGCGMGPTIAADARDKIEALPAVRSANVEIVWDPQWNPRMISEEGKKILGL